MRSPRSTAAALFAAGASRADVARRLRIARSTAGVWYRRWREAGEIEARTRGPRPRLTPPHQRRLSAVVLRPPRAAGFDLDRWSLAAIAAWIRRETGIAYHPRHVGRLLARAGFVVPPVGPHASRAMRATSIRDPLGNELLLFQKSRER